MSKQAKGRDKSADKSTDKSADLQGEGNYDATRRYDQSARDFVKSGKVDEAAQAARPANEQEAEELRRAEREGKSHSKGEDAVDPGKTP